MIDCTTQQAIETIRLIEAGKVPDSETALIEAIAAYRRLGAHLKEIEADQAAAKRIIVEIMQETGQTKAITPAGTAAFTADSVRVSYKTAGLDAICESYPDIARVLAPHRIETIVKGGLTIK